MLNTHTHSFTSMNVHNNIVYTCIYMYVTALGVLCCFALFFCLTLLASFFHLSFKNMYIQYFYNVLHVVYMHVRR